MNTKILMMASSLVMAIAGVSLSFLPQEILELFGQSPDQTLVLFAQLLGALYFGFATMNWMGKSVLIGGIYSRPLSIGNFSHFGIAGLALLKAIIRSENLPTYIWVLAVVYLFFALLFGFVFFSTPKLVSAK